MNCLLNKDILSQNQEEKIEEIVAIYNEIKSKLYENYLQKYAELFFSSEELENINIIKLMKNGVFRYDRYEYFDNYWLPFKLREKSWTKLNIIQN